MNVAAVQFKATRGQFDASMTRLVALATDGARRGVDLLVLPEMAVTGYVFADEKAIARVAEKPDGATFQALSPIAKQFGCWLVCGFPERASDVFFNSALVLNPKGERVFVYRKTLLYDTDLSWAQAGDSGYRAFDTDGGRMAPGICMDLNDDGFVRWCAGADLTAVAFATNWLEEDEPVWPYWAWRMQGLDTALVAANSYGPEADIEFCGKSAVLHQRVILAAAARTGDAVISATIPTSRDALRGR